MKVETRSEVLEILRMEDGRFYDDVMPRAAAAYAESGGKLIASAMLGYSNVCKNLCLYCGMRAANTAVKRYRLDAADVKASVKAAADLGFRRIFFVSGEDPKYGFAEVSDFCAYAKSLGFRVSLGPGEMESGQFAELKAVGVDEIVLKFEMSDRDAFNRLNPSTDFDKRLRCIKQIKELGFELASGNIIDYPGQTLDQLADDVMLMKKLEISWAPVIPYLPVKNTPLAAEGGAGRLSLLYKEISILRLMMPGIAITAQQPGEDPAKGLNDPGAHVAAIKAGANVLFCDLLPDALVKDFNVVDNRSSLGLEQIKAAADKSGLELSF